MILDIDLETKGAIELSDSGSYAYARDPGTRILVFGWRLSPILSGGWQVGREPVPDELHAAWHNPAILVRCFGKFDRIIMDHLGPAMGFPELPSWRWIDVQALSLCAGSAKSLNNTAQHLGLAEKKKDSGGIALFCKPKSKGTPEKKPQQWQDFLEYCRQDVALLPLIAKKLPPLSPFDHALQETTWRMNATGVPVDRDLLIKMNDRNTQLREWVSDQATALIGINVGSRNQIKDWLEGALGIQLESCDRGTLEGLLAADLPDNVRDIITARLIVSAKASSKLPTMIAQAIPDPEFPDTVLRVCDQFVFCGASQTGRFSGKGCQFQNFAKPKKGHDQSHIDRYLHAVKHGLLPLPGSFGDAAAEMKTMSSAMRGLVWHPRGIVSCDYSAVEVRVTAGVTDAFSKLAGIQLMGESDMRRQLAEGADLYAQMGVASSLKLQFSGITLENCKKEGWRDVGKWQILGLGYGIGVEKFRKGMSIPGRESITFEEAKGLVDAYHEQYPQIKACWSWLEKAFLQVLQYGGTVGIDGLFHYSRDGSTVILTKASGHRLFYRDVEIRKEDTSWGFKEVIVYRGINEDRGTLESIRIWGGTLFNHVIQSMSRDIMGHAMNNAGKEQELFATVHDELIIVGNEADGTRLKAIMEDVPEYAREWSLSAEVSVGERWGK